jgi:cold shock CspA family protein
VTEITGKTGPVVEYDEEEHYGYIDYKYQGQRVYLPYEEAKDLNVEDGTELAFDIRMVKGKPYATNVKLRI